MTLTQILDAYQRGERGMPTYAELRGIAQPAPNAEASTPAARWRTGGEPDPHGTHYDCERAALMMGKLTDDELANGVFMNYDQPLNVHGILAGTHSSPIAWVTAAKERIRWLSRRLCDARKDRDAALEEAAVICDEMEVHYSAYKDTALLNGDVTLSNAASGEPRACSFLAERIRALKTGSTTIDAAIAKERKE